jgi:hypothetical protein
VYTPLATSTVSKAFAFIIASAMVDASADGTETTWPADTGVTITIAANKTGMVWMKRVKFMVFLFFTKTGRC